MPARRTYTRMEKSTNSDEEQIISGGFRSSGTLLQLEGGLEECQIKRIVFSGTSDDTTSRSALVLKFGLFQDNTPDFALDDPVIYSMAVTNNSITLINETTTVRVPRGWYLGVWLETIGKVPMTGSDVGVATWNLQLNYKVLS